MTSHADSLPLVRKRPHSGKLPRHANRSNARSQANALVGLAAKRPISRRPQVRSAGRPGPGEGRLPFTSRGQLDDNPDRTISGIGLHTPADVHYGLTEAIGGERRANALAAAREATPHRFSTNTDPTVLELPIAAWINPPITQTEDQEQEPATAAAQFPPALTTLTDSASLDCLIRMTSCVRERTPSRR